MDAGQQTGQVIRMPYVRKSKRVGRFRFSRESRRGQEAFVILVVLILVLVALAVLATIWYMPSPNKEPGVTRVSAAAALYAG